MQFSWKCCSLAVDSVQFWSPETAFHFCATEPQALRRNSSSFHKHRLSCLSIGASLWCFPLPQLVTFCHTSHQTVHYFSWPSYAYLSAYLSCHYIFNFSQFHLYAQRVPFGDLKSSFFSKIGFCFAVLVNHLSCTKHSNIFPEGISVACNHVIGQFVVH